MFSNWKHKVIAFGTLLIAVITWLGFFEISAKTLLQQMTAHYLFLAAAIVFTVAFVICLRYWWRSTRVTTDNIQSKISEWLARFNYSQRLVPWDPWHFGIEVTSTRGPLVFIARPKAFGGDHLLFIGKIRGVSPQYREAFDSLPSAEREQFYGQLELETARAKIVFNSDALLDDISIEKWMPITPKFTASDMLDAISELEFSARIIWRIVSLRFGGTRSLTGPSLTPDTLKGSTADTSEQTDSQKLAAQEQWEREQARTGGVITLPRSGEPGAPDGPKRP